MSTHTPQSFQPRAKRPDKSDASSLDFTTQAVHVGTEGPRVAAYPPEFQKWGHLRFSVGLEAAEDIIGDLAAALDATFGPVS